MPDADGGRPAPHPEAALGQAPCEPVLVGVRCPLCGADEPLKIYREDTRCFGAPVSFSITRCRRCGMVYTNPRLADVNLAYEQRDTVDEQHLERYIRAKQPVFRRALRRIRSRKPPPARLLDVGCGAGDFLGMARDAGYEIAGVEASAVDVKRCNERLGRVVIEGCFESAEIEPQSLDVVTAWDVIEHVADPKGFVRKAHQVLRPGGLLAMRMPGADFHRLKGFVLGRLRGSRAVVYSPVIHLNFFSPGTLRRLLCEAGFGERAIRVYVTTAEAHARRWHLNALRIGWAMLASLLAAATGVFLDNLEIYASKPAV